ncbi:hypothetical protein [Tepidibacter sp. Z1-5]|uniref:hypothetical protein n=1 Tax=Tepidibacter sp. Z1-5 TaxID=3134138 RepID=UPI0030BE6A29
MREEYKKCGLCTNLIIKPLEDEYIELKDDNVDLEENKNSVNKIKHNQSLCQKNI